MEDYGSLSVPPKERQYKRQICVFSAVFIIFNRVIGTAGSAGAFIAALGMQVYIIWGTALPHTGREESYLEHLFPSPKRLITSIYAANAVLLGTATELMG
ncbi:hypothetical protein BDZ97DRAFT_1827402 [Flammula alnicola]|nr:hypothetical protein BDZ97DRAFT_1827402 [Flammula alnicola]